MSLHNAPSASTPTTLTATLQAAAERFGNRPAYVARRPGVADWQAPLTLTYEDLDIVATEIANGLVERGVMPGDRIALALPPSFEYLLCFLGAAKIGVAVAGVNDRLTAGEREAVVQRADPALVIARPDLAVATHECVVVEPSDDVAGIAMPIRRASCSRDWPTFDAHDPDRDVAIIFTSGTTGTPKGARYTNRQLAFITQTDLGDSWDHGGRTLTGTSFAHLGFMTKLQGNLRRGGTTFILERWRARTCLELLSAQRMTTIAGVPAQLALMLREPDFDAYDLSDLHYIIAGGGPVTAGLAEESRRRFDAKLQTRYSCTEAGIGLGTAFDDPLEDAIESVGRPHPAVALALREPHDDGRGPDVNRGEVGEVCLRSDACMRGYLNDPVATAHAFTHDGFVRTGDLGFVDDRGRVHLVGRSKEMYVRGGYNVYPVEVETVLSEHEQIASVVIVPQPDLVMGEIGIAVVVPRAGRSAPSLAEVRLFAAQKMAGYKLPDDLIVRDDLPLTAMDKLDRAALARSVAAELTVQTRPG